MGFSCFCFKSKKKHKKEKEQKHDVYEQFEDIPRRHKNCFWFIVDIKETQRFVQFEYVKKEEVFMSININIR